MASIADGIDFLLGQGKDGKVTKSGINTVILVAYALALVFLFMMEEFARVPGLPEFSFVYFVGAVCQCMGFLSLCLKVQQSKSVAGISSQSVVMTCISLGLRLFVTSVHEGYLPADNTGDYMLQVVDACTLCLVVYMLYSIHKTYGHTYETEKDELSIAPLIGFCAVLATVLHADLNHCIIYDSLWAMSLNVEIFQTLPQLLMISKVGGVVNTQTVHYVVLTFCSAACRLGFWIWAVPGCVELSLPDAHAWNIQLGGYYILGGYLLQMVVHLDFIYYYVKAWVQGSTSVRPGSVDPSTLGPVRSGGGSVGGANGPANTNMSTEVASIISWQESDAGIELECIRCIDRKSVV